MVKLLSLVLLFFLMSSSVFADGIETKPVNREESLAIKTKLKAVIVGLGIAPEKYTSRKESYELPTEMGFDSENKLYFLSESSASLIYKNGVGGEELGSDYRKKILAAQAKGDYALVQKLSMSMQAEIGSATHVEMEKIEVKIRMNYNPYLNIDPENVILDGPGYIAFFKDVDEGKTQVVLAFDPVTLAESKNISRLDLSESTSKPVAKKTFVKNVIIELLGPMDVVKSWAKSINKSKILNLVDRQEM